MGRSTRTSSGRANATGRPNRTTETPQPSPPPAELRKIEVPSYFVSNVSVGKVGNDAQLMFLRWVPTVQADGTPAPVAINEPVVLIQMSLGTLKDLSLLVGGFLQQIEQDIGQIETDFTRQQREAARASS